MALSADRPYGRSQKFTFSRRGFLQKLAPAPLLHLVSQPSLKLPTKYPAPRFHIGNKIADHWINEFGAELIEFGEIVGLCWEPREKAWAYLVNWTSGEMPDSFYPCFDKYLVIGGDVRLISHD